MPNPIPPITGRALADQLLEAAKRNLEISQAHQEAAKALATSPGMPEVPVASPGPPQQLTAG